MRVAAVALFVISVIATCFAVVVALALKIPPDSPLMLAAWSASLGVACIHVPKFWLSQVQYIVTERHVILQRGPFRRSIERSAISFARVFWNSRTPGVGDLDLVRAVPTGALRRRLLLQLRGVAAPDQVWAIIRGAKTSVAPHRGDRPLSQRLDDEERVIWSARPRRERMPYRPHNTREWSVLGLSILLFAVSALMLARALPNFRLLQAAGLPESPTATVALIIGEGLGMLLVVIMACYFAYEGIIAPARGLEQTQYLITNERVLIQRGREELHLDRSRIVDVIPAPAHGGYSDVFLVLDGPRARALAMSGAFGEAESGPQLKPVFQSVEDAESVSKILLSGRPRRRAA
jgi:hypothetical protein